MNFNRSRCSGSALLLCDPARRQAGNLGSNLLDLALWNGCSCDCAPLALGAAGASGSTPPVTVPKSRISYIKRHELRSPTRRRGCCALQGQSPVGLARRGEGGAHQELGARSNTRRPGCLPRRHRERPKVLGESGRGNHATERQSHECGRTPWVRSLRILARSGAEQRAAPIHHLSRSAGWGFLEHFGDRPVGDLKLVDLGRMAVNLARRCRSDGQSQCQVVRDHPGGRAPSRSSVRRSVSTSVASSSPTLYTLRTRFSPSSRNTLRTWRKSPLHAPSAKRSFATG